jgi:D-arginine dehydrogenase
VSGSPTILIIGGGIAGLSTAWWLARSQAVQVVLLEREVQLATHSSALNAAILRTLDADPETTAILERSADFLRQPPSGFSEHKLVETCGLVLTADEGRAAQDMARWVDHCAPSSMVEVLDPKRLREVAPFFAGDDQRAWLFPREGRLDVAHLCDSLARGAREAGAKILTGKSGSVRELFRQGNEICGVKLSDGSTLRADTVVLAAGGWADKLGRAAGSKIRMQPRRRHLLVTEADASVDPNWPIVWRHGSDFYCRPESGGMLLCGCDNDDVAEPDTLVRDHSTLGTIAEKTALNIPQFADAGAAHWWCGMRTSAPDGRFVVRFDPDLAGLFWVAGLGGHGMSAGVEVGRLATEQLLASIGGKRPPILA